MYSYQWCAVSDLKSEGEMQRVKKGINVITTRRIEVFICEDDKDLRKEYYDKLYKIRDIARDAANAATSHLFMLDNSIPYLDDKSKEMIRFVGTKGTDASRQNAAYCLMSKLFKDTMPGIMDMLSNLAQIVRKNYQEDRKQGMWDRSLRSYKGNLPIPYQKKSFCDFGFREYTDGKGNTKTGCFFTLTGIPFQMKFGRDRSGNRLIVERVLSGEYKMATSSIKVDGKKCYLLLCVDIPQGDVRLTKGKKLFAFLGVLNPIICTTDVKAYKEYDSCMKVFEIGTKEEFNYRRRQIQEAVKRCQINNKYSVGGKGRKKKCKAIERWHDKENNYVDTKLHTYSRLLVDLAVKHKCSEIVLMRQEHREDAAKDENADGDNFVLRNWTYFGMKEKIAYKCKKYGIKLTIEK